MPRTPITADATDENVLKAVEISSFDAVIVAIGDIQASILTTLTCKEMGVPYIIAKAYNDKHKKVLEKIGADYVMVPEADMAYKTANRLINQKLNDLMEVNDKYSIMEIAVPVAWSGKSLIELDVRKHFKVNVILVLAGGEEVITSPGGDTGSCRPSTTSSWAETTRISQSSANISISLSSLVK